MKLFLKTLFSNLKQISISTTNFSFENCKLVCKNSFKIAINNPQISLATLEISHTGKIPRTEWN